MQIKTWTTRPLSWSQLSAWEYNKEEWYKRYVLGEKTEPTKAMLFGKEQGERLAKDPTYMPHVPRLPISEHEMKAVFNKTSLIGYIDFYDGAMSFIELKTGKMWDKKKADNHGQLAYYATLLYLTRGIKPEALDIKLVWLETVERQDFSMSFINGEETQPVIFSVKLTMLDVLNMMSRIKTARREMTQYIKDHV